MWSHMMGGFFGGIRIIWTILFSILVAAMIVGMIIRMVWHFRRNDSKKILKVNLTE